MNMGLEWWIAVIAVPLTASIFGTIAVTYNAGVQGRKEIHQRIDKLSSDFYAYKEQAALLFATVALTREVKNDLKESLNQIVDRLTNMESDLREIVGRNTAIDRQRSSDHDRDRR